MAQGKKRKKVAAKDFLPGSGRPHRSGQKKNRSQKNAPNSGTTKKKKTSARHAKPQKSQEEILKEQKLAQARAEAQRIAAEKAKTLAQARAEAQRIAAEKEKELAQARAKMQKSEEVRSEVKPNADARTDRQSFSMKASRAKSALQKELAAKTATVRHPAGKTVKKTSGKTPEKAAGKTAAQRVSAVRNQIRQSRDKTVSGVQTAAKKASANRNTPLFLEKIRQRKREKKRRRTRDPFSMDEFMRLHKSLVVLGATIAGILLLILAAITFVRIHYRVDNVYVEGNTWYTDDQIKDMVMNGRFSHNSLYLSMKYRDKSIEDIPFIEKITVDIESADTIRINVYEKAIAGCVEYLENYMYFDRDGIVIESSSNLLPDVPIVSGLDFESIVMYQALPVENKDIFNEILDLTQLLTKYDLQADRIYFDSGYNVYLYFDNVEVDIGTEENIDEKVIQLPYILPDLEGKSGVLHLEDYDENTESIRFEESS